MARSMSRAKQEAFKNLQLDHGFLKRLLRHDGLSEDGEDFDIFLMETNVMPVLLQGLDALSRHIDKVEKSGCISGGASLPFNPLRWLAQYLLRNHPAHVKDHRTPMYQQLSELALIERGRRYLLRRQPQIEDEWREMEKAQTKAGHHGITSKDIPHFFQALDEKWGLGGDLLQKLPRDFSEILKPEKGSQSILFMEFWDWFQPFVSTHDVLRASAFHDAENRRLEAERQARKAEEDALRREQAIQEVLELRRNLEEQFDNVIIDLYVNEEIGRILNKGVVLHGVEEEEGGSPLQGEHIALLLVMLSLWGYSMPPGAPEDEWNESTLAKWNEWLTESGPEGATPGQIDSISLKALLDRDGFQDYLIRAHPVDVATDENEVHMVEVKNLFEEGLDMIVEAIDDETGEMLQLALPDNQADEVRRRLQQGGEPLMARVDLVSSRVTSLLPPASAGAAGSPRGAENGDD